MGKPAAQTVFLSKKTYKIKDKTLTINMTIFKNKHLKMKSKTKPQ